MIDRCSGKQTYSVMPEEHHQHWNNRTRNIIALLACKLLQQVGLEDDAALTALHLTQRLRRRPGEQGKAGLTTVNLQSL